MKITEANLVSVIFCGVSLCKHFIVRATARSNPQHCEGECFALRARNDRDDKEKK
jgi:hypothetical protein